jgi:sulfatase modifying factor 1
VNRIATTITAFLLALATAQAAVPETVSVGKPGNAADSTGYGAVKYEFRIGKYEVTIAEYCEFLNGVASTDAYDLYDSRMAAEYGGITRAGSSGSYSYNVKEGMGRKPVNYVTWHSAARYANWLTNGRGKSDTEAGAYTIKAGGEVTLPDHEALAAGKTTTWAIATENEWYKAAYFDPIKTGGPGYWPYAVRGGSAPACNLNTNAPSDVGSFKSASSPWGTFDQNGNLWEYNESTAGDKVGLRGGSFYLNDKDEYLRATTRYDVLGAKWPNYGFRVVALGGSGEKDSRAKPAAKPAGKPASPKAVTTPVPTATRNGPPKTFYVSQSLGDDRSTGEAASPNKKTGPWKTLARASVDYIPGDTILLKRGDTWNEELRPKGSGTPQKPITIGAYGEGNRPVIDRQDFRQDLNGIRLADQVGYKITGIEFARCMTGVYADFSKGSPTRKFLWIEDCYFHDSLVYQAYHDYPKHKIGLGICLFSHEVKNTVVLSDVTVRNCVFRRLTSGIWTNSPDNFNKNAGSIYNFANFTIEGCLFEEGYQWQLGMRGVDRGTVRHCVTHDIGRDFRAFNGVAGAMFARCKNWVFEDSEWGFISIGRRGAVSGDGEAFDFESNCDHMQMRNCLFHDTDGPGVLLCCYASGPEPERDIQFENCVFNGKAARAGENRMPRVEIINTTDLNEVTWKKCQFYLAPGVTLYATMDITYPKTPVHNLKFVDCRIQNLSATCRTPPLPAKLSVSPTSIGNDAAKTSATSPAFMRPVHQMELHFRKPTVVNAFKIKEAPTSAVSRYVIECWDDKKSDWVGCFNGAAIGAEFVAPIVGRTTSKARLSILKTAAGGSKVTSFEAYNDTAGEVYNAMTGGKPSSHVGK